MAKKYRLEYVYCFIPKDPIQGFKYKNENVLDISILVRFKVYENGIERFFEDEEALFYSEAANKDYYIPNLIKCYYDGENMSYKLEENLYALQLAYLVL